MLDPTRILWLPAPVIREPLEGASVTQGRPLMRYLGRG